MEGRWEPLYRRDETAEALGEIRELLDRYDFRLHSSYVSKLLELRSTDSPQFREAVLANEIWGGEGSVCDIYLPASRVDDTSSHDDQRRMHRAIVRLADALSKEGISDDRVVELSTVFRKWDDEGR